MKDLFLLLGVCCCTSLSAQNLVADPGFEGHTTCPVWVSDLGALPLWWAPNTATTDHYHTCAATFGCHAPFNMAGKQRPHGGEGYVGIITQANDLPYTELVQGRLTEPLKKGSYYKVSYHVSLAEVSRNPDPRLGVCFTADSTAWPYRTAPPCPKGYALEQLEVPPITGTDDWVLVTGMYKAKGDERFIMLGNVQGTAGKGDLKRNKHARSKVKDAMGYWYIDDVAVVKARNRSDTAHVRDPRPSRHEITAGGELLLAPCKGIFQEGSSAFVDMKALHAIIQQDTGSVPAAAMLDYLNNFLLQNEDMVVEVGVHTVPMDDRDAALALSQARAVALVARLLEQGVRKDNVVAVGHGAPADALPPGTDPPDDDGRITLRVVRLLGPPRVTEEDAVELAD